MKQENNAHKKPAPSVMCNIIIIFILQISLKNFIIDFFPAFYDDEFS